MWSGVEWGGVEWSSRVEWKGVELYGGVLCGVWRYVLMWWSGVECYGVFDIMCRISDITKLPDAIVLG
jgi:hypothetical protein